jgi:hypothetical protein
MRLGRLFRRNPLLAGVCGVILLAVAAVLLEQEGALFVAGFCLLCLSVTVLYVALRGFARRLSG